MSIYQKYPAKAEKYFSALPSSSKSQALAYIDFLIYRQMSPHTIQAAIYNLSRFFQYLDEDQQEDFSKVAKSEVREFLSGLSSLSPSQINCYASFIKSFFNFLVDEDVVSKNPVLSRYFVEGEKRLPRPMKTEHRKIFLAHLMIQPLREQAMFLLMLRSGLRVGEVCRLSHKDIYWEHQQIIIRNSKGKVDRMVYFCDPLCEKMSQRGSQA